METICICKLCFEDFGEEIRPRGLPCGHSYCTECLNKLIKNGSLSCPTCKRNHRIGNAKDFSINYDLEESLSYARIAVPQLANKAQSSTKITKLQTLISEQKLSIHNLLIASENMQSQLKEYDEFLLKENMIRVEVLQKIRELEKLHVALFKEINDERKKIIYTQKEGDGLGKNVTDKLPNLDNAMSNRFAVDAVADIDDCSSDLEDWIERCKQEFPYPKIAFSQRVATESLDILSLLVSRKDEEVPEASGVSDIGFTILEKVADLGNYPTLTIDRLRLTPENWKKQVAAGRVYAIHSNNGIDLSAALSEKDGKLYLHHLHKREVSTTTRPIKYNEVMKLLDKNSSVAFMDLAWDGSFKGRVHILLSPDTPLARHFRSLCTGELGPSYAHSRFHGVCYSNNYNECLRGGDYQHSNGTGGASVMVGLNKMDDIYSRLWEAGVIYASPNTTELQGAQFSITTGSGRTARRESVFGKVQDGLHVLRAAAAFKNIKQVEIRDCGVVLPL